MPIQVPNFTTTASITGATLVSQADEQLNLFMDDVESYVESTYGTVANSLEDEFSTQLALTTTKAQEAATSATSALASKNAAATSATNANTSATNSANSAGLATTKAQEASASAAAANADKVSAAASAADALASKNAAAVSETNSASSATDALASKNDAATSAMDAASIYDMFDDRYLGSKALDPLVDNDGGALQAGALYFNSTNNSVKVYTGTAWLALSSIDAYTKAESNASLALKVNNSEKGIANGLATLDVNGKVVLTQIPDSVLGQLEYMGIHNFTTLPTATQKGQYWIASVSGNGYIAGDWAVWNGAAFDKVDNTDAVATVAGRTGNVVLTKSDVGLANVDNTADTAKPVSTAQQAAIDTKVTKVTSTDNAIVRFDGTTGSVQNSGVIIDDSGNITQNNDIVLKAKDTSGVARQVLVGRSATTNTTYLDGGTGGLKIRVNNGLVESINIDSAGNVGIGVTPSAWASNYKALDIGLLGSISYGYGELNFGANYYATGAGTYAYKYASQASRYVSVSGTHTWQTAPSGTAGNAITWTNAMILDASGVLNVQNLNDTQNFSKRIVIGDSTGLKPSHKNFIEAGSTSWGDNGYMAFGTQNSENMRISTSGNLLIGTTTDNGVDKLQVNGSAKIGRQVTKSGGWGNVQGIQTIDFSSIGNGGGTLTVISVQGGVGQSCWNIPFVRYAGVLTLGTPTKAITTADPIGSVTSSSGNILVNATYANTNMYYTVNSTLY